MSDDYEPLITVGAVIFLGAATCTCLGGPSKVGLDVGHAEATCWARGSEYVSTTSIGIVCGDGAVVPILKPPEGE